MLMIMLGYTCLQINNNRIFLENQLLIKERMTNLSVNVRNFALSLKVWLGETLLPFKKYNMIMSGLNMDKLLILLKFQMVMIQ